MNRGATRLLIHRIYLYSALAEDHYSICELSEKVWQIMLNWVNDKMGAAGVNSGEAPGS